MNTRLKKVYGQQILPFNLPLDELHKLHTPAYYSSWIAPQLKGRNKVTFVRLCMMAELDRWFSLTRHSYAFYKVKSDFVEPVWEPLIFLFSPKRGKFFYYNRHLPMVQRVADYCFYLDGSNNTGKGKSHRLVFEFLNAN